MSRLAGRRLLGPPTFPRRVWIGSRRKIAGRSESCGERGGQVDPGGEFVSGVDSRGFAYGGQDFGAEPEADGGRLVIISANGCGEIGPRCQRRYS